MHSRWRIPAALMFCFAWLVVAGCVKDTQDPDVEVHARDAGDRSFALVDDHATVEPGLCVETGADPYTIPDRVFINCTVERGDVESSSDEVPEAIRVVTWNIERGFEIDAMIRSFAEPPLAEADVILLQEADRGCPRTDWRHVARELAESLGMSWAYGVEFIELSQESCEHGNAVLSRFPIGDAFVHRVTPFEEWLVGEEDEPRLGGRMILVADLDVGGRRLQVGSYHGMSRLGHYDTDRVAQVTEAMDALDFDAGPTVWGGDLNSGLYYYLGTEAMIEAVFARAYEDALAGLPADETITSPDPVPMRLDWLFARWATTLGGHVADEPANAHLSDHLAVWADVATYSF